MPWNNESGGGGWKSGGGNGGGPWGQGPWGQGGQGGGGGGGGQGPNADLEEILKRSQDRMKRAMGGGGLPGPLVFLAGVAGAAVLAFYAFTFTVREDQLGIVLRFGEFVRQAGPGLHIRYPFPIEEVELPQVTREKNIEIGFRPLSTRGGGTSAAKTKVEDESLMLTGDQNIVDVEFTVVWRIDDAKKYLFNIQDQEKTVRDVAEAAMREVVGQSSLDPLLTTDRSNTAARVLAVLQETLNGYDAGIKVVRVNIADTDPPEKVIQAFKDVESARADQQRLQEEAKKYSNRVIQEAIGDASKITQAAEGYKQRVTNEATGQADRFNSVYNEYSKAPEVTRKRIFLETMERVFGGTDKIILDSKGGSGVVPYLPLNELSSKPRPQAGTQ